MLPNSYHAAISAKRLFEQKTAEADNMRAVCPICQREGCKVRAGFSQATRAEPMAFLGFQGFCPDCTVAFPAAASQLILA